MSSRASASTSLVTIHAPYMYQGGSGSQETVNCGPAAVAMAVNYSGAASPTVSEVRAALGMPGPTDINQWASLLDWYGVSWYPTWSQIEIDNALRKGHPIVIASWMESFSVAADFEAPWAEVSAWQGRYCDYALGHSMLIVGIADDSASYLVHDPNVFPDDPAHHYIDGSPKGAFRRYKTAEVWKTVSTYADGLGLAIVPMSQSLPNASRVKRIDPDVAQFTGPGGGHRPRRESAAHD